MKRIFSVLFAAILFLMQACSAGNATEASSPQEPVVPPVTETSVSEIPQPIVETTLPDMSQSTAVILSSLPTLTSPAEKVAINPISESGILLQDNGKAFHMQAGDSFLLNLGTGIYDWTVTVDNESVLHLKMGVMVIRGAQGIYDALAPGTAVLSAIGNPTCLQTNPPCAMPSILFKVTVIVK